MKRLLLIMAAIVALSASAKKPRGTTVEMLTTKGKIVLCLYDDTPLHRDNFIKLANSGFYDGLLFHRVIKDFMIQGGDPDSRNAAAGAHLGEGGPGYEIPAEIFAPSTNSGNPTANSGGITANSQNGQSSQPALLHFHKQGALAAARTGDEVNPERKSSGSQFYIVWGKTYTDAELDKMDAYLRRTSNNTVSLTPQMRKYYRTYGGTPHLDGSYTVFGEVVKGLKVVDAIQNVQTDKANRPVEDIKIIKVVVKK